MYLVHDWKKNTFVFTTEDPRVEGFTNPVETDVTYEDSIGMPEWPAGTDSASPVLGRMGKAYKVFASDKECRSSGYRPVGTNYTSPYETYELYLRGR